MSAGDAAQVLPPGGQLGTMVDVEAESGVNEGGDGFVTMRVHGTLGDGTTVVLIGQLPPGGARAAGLELYGAGEAADLDAGVLRIFTARHPGDPQALEAAAAVVSMIREARDQPPAE